MFTEFDLSIKNIYSDLFERCVAPVSTGENLRFIEKEIKGSRYLYLESRLGKSKISKYLGAVNDAELTHRRQEEEKLWQSTADSDDVKARMRLVTQLQALRVTPPPAVECKILRLLERGGVFLSGGVVIGTPAFNLMGLLLGGQWQQSFMTKDLDLAASPRLAVGIGSEPPDLEKLIVESGLGFFPVPSLNPKHPSTKFKLTKQDFIVDLLTPMQGKPDNRPVRINSLGAWATPLRFLDFLLEHIVPVVVPFDKGILVNIPEPARFAIHKLVVSERREAAQTYKKSKDREQAEQLLTVLLDINPGAILVAIESAQQFHNKFFEQFKAALKHCDADLQEALAAWLL